MARCSSSLCLNVSYSEAQINDLWLCAWESQIGHLETPTLAFPSVILALMNPNETLKTGWDGLLQALDILVECSDWFPPLKAAAGGLRAVTKLGQKYVGVQQDIEELRNNLFWTAEIIEKYSDESSRRSADITESFNDLSLFLRAQSEIVQKKLPQNRSFFARLSETSVDTDDITETYKALSLQLSRLNLSITSEIEAITNDILNHVTIGSMIRSHNCEFNTELGGTHMTRNGCMEDTSEFALDLLSDWVVNDGAPVFFLSGMAGMGKTTIAYTFCERLPRLNCNLGASFFCSRELPDCRESRLVIPSIAFQLARSSRAFAISLVRRLHQDPAIPEKKLDIQLHELLELPWKNSRLDSTRTMDGGSKQVVIVIDALDECQDSSRFLELLLKAIHEQRFRGLKFLFTSRPESITLAKFSQSKVGCELFRLHDLNQEKFQPDIEAYLSFHIGRSNLDIVPTLVEQCAGLWIYASTITRYISQGGAADSRARLNTLLYGSLGISRHGAMPLDRLYGTILDVATRHLESTELEQFHAVLDTLVCSREPLSVNTVAVLLQLATDRVRDIVRCLTSIYRMDDNSNTIPIVALHASFGDYMWNPERSSHCMRLDCHQRRLTHRCFEIMQSNLRFNICDLPSSFLPDEEVSDLEYRIEKNISVPLRYCCSAWAYHMQMVGADDCIVTKFSDFLSSQLLFWMEAMNLISAGNQCGSMLRVAEKWMESTSDNAGDVTALLHDCENFLPLFFGSPISKYTPHLYVSALSLTAIPRIRSYYRPDFLGTAQVLSSPLSHDGRHLLTISPPSSVRPIAISPNSSSIASGSHNGIIRLWDAATGRQVGDSFEGHTSSVLSLAFSPDGSQIVSGSQDKTIRIWKTATGEQCGESLYKHRGPVRSVAFSPDGSKIVSGSDDETILMSDAATGQQVGRSFKGHAGSVASVAFSPDGMWIVSGSYDKTVRIWDAATGQQVGESLEGNRVYAASVAFSPDGSRIISGSDEDHIVRIWDAGTRELIGELFDGRKSEVYSVAFSPDGSRILSGTADGRIRIWDSVTLRQVGEPLEGHTQSVGSVTFSPDGSRIVSRSADNTIRIWDAAIAQHSGEWLEGHKDSVMSVAFSPDRSRIVSGSHDETIRMWDATTGREIGKPLQGHTDWVLSVAFSPDGSRIVSGSEDATIRIWDLASGQQVGEPLEGHRGAVNSVAFSPDGSQIISASSDATICMWDVATGQQIGEPLEGHHHVVDSVAISPDGSRIVSGSSDKTICIWNFATRRRIGEPLEGHRDVVNSVAFSPDGSQIISASSDPTICMWDAATGQLIWESVEGYTDLVWSVAFSPDGSRIVSGSFDGSVQIWDAATGLQIGESFEGHAGSVQSVSFSPDGSQIASGSEDDTIRIWNAATNQPSQTQSSHHDGTCANCSALCDHRLSQFLDFSTGWVKCKSCLAQLLWIPHHLRSFLDLPGGPIIISRRGTLRLDFSTACFGTSWADCYGKEFRQ